MAAQLQESYASLEQKVEARTRELAEKGRQLELASQHKSQFLANMSHELRTPMNAILGYTELIMDHIYGEVPEKIGEVLERVQQSGHHLLDLINDVLDISKMEAGRSPWRSATTPSPRWCRRSSAPWNPWRWRKGWRSRSRCRPISTRQG